MTALAEYLIKANLCLAGFYALYYLLLRRHTFFGLNRAYLLVALVASFVLPLISLPEPVVETVSLPIISLPVTIVATESTGPTLEEGLLAIYGLGALVFLTLLGVSLWRLMRLIRSGEATRQTGHTLVLLADERVAPFSFFRYLVLNQTDFEQHPDPIIRHELAHIRQWHSADVLLAELVKVVCWPNPVAWLYKRSLQQVHEYLADQQAADKAQYARFLFDYAFQGGNSPVVNSFFTPALLTQRIRMLYQSRNTNRVLWKYALALPLLAILVGLTAAREPITQIVMSRPGPMTTVSGWIIDEAGKPVRAAIVVAGGSRGTETTAGGYFKLAGVTNSTKLAVSSVGFENQYVVAMDSKPITVILKRTRKVLDEVVVVGYDPKPELPKNEGELFTIVEQNPEFPGGMPAMGQYLGRNLRYPSEARKKHTSGLVFVQFVVGTDGAIQSPRILKGIGNGCDEEAVRIVSQMPRWNPGKQSGVPVSVQFTLPIRFELEGNTTQNTTIGSGNKTTGKNLPMDSRSLNVQYHVPLQLPLEDIKNKTVIGNGGEKPLIVIDGEEQDLNTIKPDDIQSINVLKGSSAQATYGEKGKNGVIEITTKAKKP